jgi:hypothetical protein
MSEFKVEKGIPLLDNRKTKNRRYPWRQLDVGDSFFIPEVTVKSICGSLSYARKSTHCAFSCRAVEGGVRIWRIA